MNIAHRLQAATAATALIVLAIAGCSGGTQPDSGSADSQLTRQSGAGGTTPLQAGPADGRDAIDKTGAAARAAPADGQAAQGQASSEQAAGDQALSPSTWLAPSDQQMIVTGSIDLVANDPLATADKIANSTLAAGGRIDARTERGSGLVASASLTLRLPGDKTNSTIEAIKKLGKASVEVGQEDVTTQAIDLEQRISGLQASVSRMEQLISKASTTADILAIESKLTERATELRSLKTQRDALRDQVALSTINVSITAPPRTAPPEPRTGPGAALATGWGAFVDFLTAIVNAVAVALPFLAFFALVGGAIVLGIRSWRRRHPARVRATSPTPAAHPAPHPPTPASVGESADQ